ncbi:PDZ domain-containing protein 9 [Acipenser oxyrinchus oxyrinchus]|uniref:PDZ domain-containing protein 9 n=1 Tax=Acipenser oxyrinchus oxyrinchus TaxID=40147 RepID=A0AAD8D628_ACIOX|nr:PDZ domain-containing protein 9 [Acipenser oxyrinchus oxyrinchus]
MKSVLKDGWTYLKEQVIPEVQKRSSCHELGKVLETDLQMGPHGLGLTVIENKHFLQITKVSQSSIAAKNGVLQPGDVLIKIGSVEALGCKLREIMQQIKAIPVGTVLSIMVYRDYLLIPEGWERRASPDKPSKSTTSCSIERCKEEADIIDEMQRSTAFQTPMISLLTTRTESSTEVPSLQAVGHNGLGMVIVEHGLLLQIIGLIEKGPAAKNGRLKPGDVL